MHPLLGIQLRKTFGEDPEAFLDLLTDLRDQAESRPGDPYARITRNLGRLLESVDAAYVQFDRDAALAHRSLVLSNEELVGCYALQQGELERQARALDGLRQSAEALLGHEMLYPPGDDLERLATLIRQLVTEREDARRELQASERLHRQVVNSVHEVILQTTPDLAIAFLNAAWEDFTGLGVADGLGRPLLEIIDPEDRPALATLIEGLQEGVREQGMMEVRLSPEGGTPRWVCAHLSLSRILGGIQGSLRDITDRRLAEEALLQAQKLESLGVLAGGIAHDFNNLLVPIRGNLELVLRRLEPDHPARPGLAAMNLAATRASDIVRQLLDYAGKGRFHFESLEINTLLAGMESLLRLPGHPGMSARLHLHGGPLHLEGDATQLRQAIFNLVVNAADAQSDQGGPIHLTTGTCHLDSEALESCAVHAADPGPFVFLRVRDEGCGMNEETLRRIFDPFFSTKSSGRGLGLAVTFGIVRNHRGAIRVDSQVDHGTTFTLYFPRTAPPQDEVPERPAAQEAPREGLKVLVVDDEHPNLVILSEFLAHLGYTPQTALSGRKALSILQSGPHPDLVLLDLSMPDMDGSQTLRALRTVAPSLPVLLMSGYSEPHSLRQLDGQTWSGFLQKPFSLEDLRSAIREALELVDQAPEPM